MTALALSLVLAAGAAEPAPADLPTVLAIGVGVYAASALVHEGLGHETGCLLGGGRPMGTSLAVAGCDEAGMSAGGHRLLVAGGATANLLVGAGLGTALWLAPPEDGAAYYALWLASVVNLLQAGGYLMVGPWAPIGDFGEEGFVRDVGAKLPAKLGLSAAGLGLTAGTLFWGNALSEPLLGADPQDRSDRQWRLTLPSYLGGAGLVTAGSLLNRVGPEYAVSAAVANFAGTLFLAYVPLFFSSDAFYPDPAGRPAQALPIERSPLWIGLGTTVALGSVLVFGPGVGDFPTPHPLDPTR